MPTISNSEQPLLHQTTLPGERSPRRGRPNVCRPLVLRDSPKSRRCHQCLLRTPLRGQLWCFRSPSSCNARGRNLRSLFVPFCRGHRLHPLQYHPYVSGSQSTRCLSTIRSCASLGTSTAPSQRRLHFGAVGRRPPLLFRSRRLRWRGLFALDEPRGPRYLELTGSFLAPRHGWPQPSVGASVPRGKRRPRRYGLGQYFPGPFHRTSPRYGPRLQDLLCPVSRRTRPLLASVLPC